MAHIVDDDEAVRESLLALMGAWDVPAQAYASGPAFLSAWSPELGGCIITDIQMPDMGGLELLQALNARGSALPVIVITAQGDGEKAERARALGAVAVLQKPFAPPELVGLVRRALAGGAVV